MPPHGERLLGLPVPARSVAVASVLATFAVLVLTMQRDFGVYDGGELALAAVVFGVGHPTGQPLHALLGGLLARIPFVSPLTGVALVSALSGALMALTGLSLAHVCARHDRRLRALPAWSLGVVATCVTLVPARWSAMSRIEVYALSAAAASWAVARMADALDRGPTARDGWLVGIALGLSAGSNPVIAVFTAVSMAVPAVPRAMLRGSLGARVLLTCVAGGLLALGLYVYVPLAAMRTDVFAWGRPVTGASLRHFFSAADYASSLAITPERRLANVGAWVRAGLADGTFWFVAGGLAGGARAPGALGLLRWGAPVQLALALWPVWSNRFYDPRTPDYGDYGSVAYAFCAAGWLVLAAELVRAGGAGARRSIAAAVTVLSAMAVGTPLLHSTRRLDHFAHDLARAALDSAPRRAIVIVHEDHWVFPLLYLQEAEHVRPDVTVVADGLAGASWYWERILAQHPDLAPFALRGPGRTVGRLQRLLRANADRPAMVSRLDLARQLGGGTDCTDAFFLRIDGNCTEPPVPPAWATARLEGWARTLGGRAEPSDDALTAITEARGHLLASRGWLCHAARVWIAGAGSLARGLGPLACAEAAVVPPRSGLAPEGGWTDEAPLGDPRRNACLAARALSTLGGDSAGLAEALLGRAAEAGLREARGTRIPSGAAAP